MKYIIQHLVTREINNANHLAVTALSNAIHAVDILPSPIMIRLQTSFAGD